MMRSVWTDSVGTNDMRREGRYTVPYWVVRSECFAVMK